jgi:hypothetical protein
MEKKYGRGGKGINMRVNKMEKEGVRDKYTKETIPAEFQRAFSTSFNKQRLRFRKALNFNRAITVTIIIIII